MRHKVMGMFCLCIVNSFGQKQHQCHPSPILAHSPPDSNTSQSAVYHSTCVISFVIAFLPEIIHELSIDARSATGKHYYIVYTR